MHLKLPPEYTTHTHLMKMVKGNTTAIAYVFAVLATVALAVMVNPADALGCSDVASSVGQCSGYASGAVPQPPAGCCAELRRLSSLAPTTADRRQICHCIIQFVAQNPRIKDPALASLPQKCGVRVPVPVSRNTDCNRVP